ncbi:hypothetical protein ACIBCA_20560 [Kitasatospora sp. NPDC051170]|uniref:hypothetical protein n=1 Tax=Kitasatospora sp. NPDC051170 TaxID=3364056 RepID=UPI0037915BE4
MLVSIASAPNPGRIDEDFAIAGRHTRELERSDPQRRRRPRSKCHDDATAVLVRQELAQ